MAKHVIVAATAYAGNSHSCQVCGCKGRTSSRAGTFTTTNTGMQNVNTRRSGVPHGPR